MPRKVKTSSPYHEITSEIFSKFEVLLGAERPQNLCKFYLNLELAQNEEEGRAIMEKLLDFVRQRGPAYAKELEEKT